MAGAKYFISYSRLDSEIALKIATDLKQAGANVWLDQLDIAPGEIWDLTIEKALEGCEYLLFILSASSVASTNVVNEVYYGLDEKKRVIPIMINECKAPFRIKRLQHIDFIKSYDQGLRVLLKTINAEQRTPPPAEEPQREVKQPASPIDQQEEENKIQQQHEEDLWQSALRENTIVSYKQYLRKSALRLQVDDASAKIEALTKDGQDNDLWQKANKSNLVELYNEYVSKYPNGKYTQEAQTKIDELETASEEGLWRKARNLHTIAGYESYLGESRQLKYRDEANIAINDLKVVTRKDQEEQLPEAKKVERKTTKPKSATKPSAAKQVIKAEESNIADMAPAAETASPKSKSNSLIGIIIFAVLVIVLFVWKPWKSSPSIVEKEDGVAGTNRTTTPETETAGTTTVNGRITLKKAPYVLPTPPFQAQIAITTEPKNVSLFRKVWEKPNEIIDDQLWFKNNGLTLPMFDEAYLKSGPIDYNDASYKDKVPDNYNGNKLTTALEFNNVNIFTYGANYAESKYLLITNKSMTRALHFLDFSNYTYAPKNIEQDKEYVFQQINWAVVNNNVLYVSTGHNTYAKSSYGMNAYITAIDLTNYEIIWRSKPLVCNSRNFQFVDDNIVCGYGFTAEPDFLYTINMYNGKVNKKIPLRSGPSYIIKKNNKIYIRTYDTDYEFEFIPLGTSVRPTDN